MSLAISVSRYFKNLLHPSGYFLLSSKNQLSNMTESAIKVINFESLKERVMNKDVTVIDVREPNEIKDEGKIPHSVNIPLGQILEAFQLQSSEFNRKYCIEKPEESDDFVISCRSGKRASTAFSKLQPLGYKNASVYIGSFQDWQQKGGPIEKE